MKSPAVPPWQFGVGMVFAAGSYFFRHNTLVGGLFSLATLAMFVWALPWRANRPAKPRPR